MNRYITYDKLRQFAYSNDKLIKGEIKGIVLNFSGCSIYAMYDTDTPLGKFYAEHNIIFIIPYYNPWSWMNKQAVSLTDEIMDVIFEKYGLKDDIPIASTGGSMGGQGAIVYMARAKRTPEICIANCPNCDAVNGLKNKQNIPRTLYSAFYHEDGDILDIIKKYSPIHIIDELPKSAEYHLFHGDNDAEVNYTAHSKRLYEKMKEQGFDITFTICKGRDHAKVIIDSDIPAKKYILKRFGIKADSFEGDLDFNHTV